MLKSLYKILIISFISINCFGQIYYVTPTGSGIKDGSNWVNATDMAGFRTMLNAAVSGDTIYVSAGTYTPLAANRFSYFEIKDGVRVYGGFSSTDTLFSQRNWRINKTILSGEIFSPSKNDNSYHVVYISQADTNTVLDGFEITRGYANGWGTTMNGGGLYVYSNSIAASCKARISNCFFYDNVSFDRGGAVYVYASNGSISQMKFSNCMFISNVSDTGGAVYNQAWVNGITRPEYDNCIFAKNKAYKGGAVYNNSSTCITCLKGNVISTYINCTFTENIATNYGSVICDKSRYGGFSSDTLINCIVWNNSLPAIYNIHPKRVVLRYSDYEGGWNGRGNFNKNFDPMFAKTGDDPYSILPCSPCIDKGSVNRFTANDFNDIPRPQLSGVDMGAYESVTQATGAGKYYVNATATGANNGSNWTNAFTDLQSALNACNVDTIWVAKGTYYPTTGTDRLATFFIRSGLKVIGGFYGNEDSLIQRNTDTNICILSGAIGLPTDTDNIASIVTFRYASPQTLLDGFTITDGYALKYPQTYGTAIFNLAAYSASGSSPEIANCTIINSINNYSYGSAIYNNCREGGSCKSIFRKCKFISNSVYYGSLIFNDGFNANTINIKYRNCLFANNNTDYWMIYNSFSGTAVSMGSYYTNCTFADNNSRLIGYSGYPNITGKDTLINCIIWNNINPAIDTVKNHYYLMNCDYQNGWMGTGINNINANPLFIKTGIHAYALSACSPCINTGNSYLAPTTDLAGNPRPQLNSFDIGAYESMIQGSGQNKVYVNANASGANTGLNWNDAFTDLQSALTGCVDTVWVAAGTYKPTSANNRFISFDIPSGFKIFGGFAGNEDSLSQRNWNINKTILSGNIGNPTDSDNVYHVVQMHNVDSTTELNGFVIRDGFCDKYIGNFMNAGAGLYNDGSWNNSGSNPLIVNCTFTNNSAGSVSNYSYSYGGAVFNNGYYGNCRSRFINCKFENCKAYYAGAVYNYGSYGVAFSNFTNCVFYNNKAYYGGAVATLGNYYNGSNRQVFSNCTFAYDSAQYYGAIVVQMNVSTVPVNNDSVVNCIFWNCSQPAIDIDVTYAYPKIKATLINCSYQGGWPGIGSGNIDADPMFIGSGADSLRLAPCSNCINAGTGLFSPTTDIDGNARIQLGAIDIGAYEVSLQNASKHKIYVNKNSTGANNGQSWQDAYTNLQLALRQTCVDTIWVAKGVYKPTTSNDRHISFQIRSGLKMFGGFNGTETNLNQRRPRKHRTFLSGNIGSITDSTDNSVHIVNISYADSTTILDGFIIREGYCEFTKHANDGLKYYYGGAGLYNNGSYSLNGSNPQIINCTFSFNRTTELQGCYNSWGNGGGVYNNMIMSQKFKTKFINCKFIHNKALAGSAVYNEFSVGTKSNVSFTNCLFQGNRANCGGAIATLKAYLNYNINMPIVNRTVYNSCTFVKNFGKYNSSVIYNSDYSTDSIRNSIFWDNSLPLTISYSPATVKIYYSDVQGSWSGTGSNNFSAYPVFADTSTYHFQLQACSPCINMADYTAPSYDLFGLPRPSMGGSDLGAFEYQDTVALISINALQGNILCNGLTTSFEANVEYPNNYLLHWFLNGNYTGVDSSTFAPATLNDGDTIICLLIKNPGCAATDTVFSNNIVMTINPKYNIINVVELCTGDSIFIGGNWQTTDGTFLDSLTTMAGCDSVVNTQWSFKPVIHSYDSIFICNGDSIFLNGAWQFNSAIFSDTVPSSFGCDSIAYLTLTVHPVYNTTDTITIFQGDSAFINGQWQTVAGVYTNTLVSQLGCDSIANTVLNVFTSVTEIDNTSLIIIIPNPAINTINISMNCSGSKQAELSVYSSQGQLLLKDKLLDGQAKQFDINLWARGVYLVQINCNCSLFYKKFVKM